MCIRDSVATGRADAAGEYEYVINSAIKDRGLPLKAVGDVLAVVPTYFLSKRTDDMKPVSYTHLISYR